MEAGAAVRDTGYFTLSILPPLTCGFLAAKWLCHFQASHLPPKQEERGKEKVQRTKTGPAPSYKESKASVEAPVGRLLVTPRMGGSSPHL